MFGKLLGLAASIFGFFKGLFDRRREEAIRESGRLEQRSADQQAAIEAQRRQQEADAAPRKPTETRLDDGTF